MTSRPNSNVYQNTQQVSSAMFNITFGCRDARADAELWGAATGCSLEHVVMPDANITHTPGVGS